METHADSLPGDELHIDSESPPMPGVQPPPIPLPPPRPVIALEYIRAQIDRPPQWIVVAECKTVAEWHSIKAALGRANILAYMSKGATRLPTDERGESGGPELMVRDTDVPLARRIVQAYRGGKPWCPYCGSLSVRELPAAWYWYILAVIFLMYPPFWPPSKACDSCGQKW